MREENEDVGALAAGKGIDRSTAGIARCGADDCRAFVAFGKNVIHQARKQLHRHILEGERRAVEEFENEIVRPDLHQRHHGRVAESGIGLVDHGLQLVIGNLAIDEKRQNLEGDFLVGFAAQGTDLFFRKGRPLARDIQAAVFCKPGHERITKAESGCCTTGRNVFHDLESLIDFCSDR
ncbi:hypothetical protein D3C80_1057890 [compost metagenome]